LASAQYSASGSRLQALCGPYLFLNFIDLSLEHFMKMHVNKTLDNFIVFCPMLIEGIEQPNEPNHWANEYLLSIPKKASPNRAI
jgi:hypothetical protein